MACASASRVLVDDTDAAAWGAPWRADSVTVSIAADISGMLSSMVPWDGAVTV